MSDLRLHFNTAPAPFRAFRLIKVSDGEGLRTEIIVPNGLTPEDVNTSVRRVEHFAVMHAGAFAEVTYQAYLGCVDWFRFHRKNEMDGTVCDFLGRIRRSLVKATKYHQRMADADFIEAYFGAFVGDQTKNIERARSAAYDVFKELLPQERALDAAFVAQIYICACYQCSVAAAVVRGEHSMSGINWDRALRKYFLDDVAEYADRLLQRKYHINILAVKDRITKIGEYVFEDMTRTAFDPSRIERNIREAFADLPDEKKAMYGSVEEQLENYPIPRYVP